MRQNVNDDTTKSSTVTNVSLRIINQFELSISTWVRQRGPWTHKQWRSRFSPVRWQEHFADHRPTIGSILSLSEPKLKPLWIKSNNSIIYWLDLGFKIWSRCQPEGSRHLRCKIVQLRWDHFLLEQGLLPNERMKNIAFKINMSMQALIFSLAITLIVIDNHHLWYQKSIKYRHHHRQ